MTRRTGQVECGTAAGPPSSGPRVSCGLVWGDSYAAGCGWAHESEGVREWAYSVINLSPRGPAGRKENAVLFLITNGLSVFGARPPPRSSCRRDPRSPPGIPATVGGWRSPRPDVDRVPLTGQGRRATGYQGPARLDVPRSPFVDSLHRQRPTPLCTNRMDGTAPRSGRREGWRVSARSFPDQRRRPRSRGPCTGRSSR